MKRALPVAVLAIALALAGCMTKRIDPPPSAALVEARAKAKAAKTAKVDPCALYTFSAAAPVIVDFAYGSVEPAEEGEAQIGRLGVWLGCHPEVPVQLVGVGDSTGLPAARKVQAEARAAAVRTRLAAVGVAPQRLLADPPTSGAALVVEAKGRGW